MLAIEVHALPEESNNENCGVFVARDRVWSWKKVGDGAHDNTKSRDRSLSWYGENAGMCGVGETEGSRALAGIENGQTVEIGDSGCE
jgi:hypothetical protein